MITILQVIVSIILTILILLQERSSGLSGVLGGSAGNTPYQTRRGVEKMIFNATIILAVLFFALAILNIVL